MPELRPRQRQLLMILVSYLERRKPQPSLRELARLMEVASISTVHYHLSGLEKEGYLQRISGPQGALRVTESGLERCRRSFRRGS